jgi:antitoxin CptB
MNESASDSAHQSDPQRRARLRWRARRGLLENDLIFERFFSRYEHDLSDADVGVLTQLLELSDNDLMDLLLARKEPDGALVSPDMTRVLEMLRSA